MSTISYTEPGAYIAEAYAIGPTPARHISEIIDKLAERTTAVHAAEAEEQAARRPERCCGSEYIDPAGYLWANHGINDDCPLHGRHPKAPGRRRLKTYIGADMDKQAAVRQAMANWRQWQRKESALQEAQRELARLERRVKELHEVVTGKRRWGWDD